MIDVELKEQQILSGLKDFQRATVDRIYCLFTGGRSRVLVADEVGLGKTLIAKGVVAKMARYHKHTLNADLFKVVYICSNQNIAGQNLAKLKINDNDRIDSLGDTRLSMQHLKIYEDEIVARQKSHYIQLIPLTPHTSFTMTGGSGSVQERALIYAILWRYTPLAKHKNELELIMKDYAAKSWNWAKNYYEKRVSDCNLATRGEYLRRILSEVDDYFSSHPEEFRLTVDNCNKVRDSGGRPNGSHSIIHRLRRMMAEISVDLMNANLVIMDEFQRFPELLHQKEDNETSILARRFLNNTGLDEHLVNVLLLSATPYKLYSTLEEMNESGQDEHYREFMQVVQFLFEHHSSLSSAFTKVWGDYSRSLHELGTEEFTVLTAAKRRAEDLLYEGIARTERLSVAGSTKFLDTVADRGLLEVTGGDVQSYVEADMLLQEIGLQQTIPVDYIKSAPFLLSFMEHYKLKEQVANYFRKHPDQLRIARKPSLWVNEQAVAKYEKLADTNARMKRLREEVLPKGAERLMWMPPSRPYYEGGGPFAEAKYFSKTLVFSSWEMVPRAIATLISYEAERLTVGDLIRSSPNPNHENRSYFPRTNRARFPAPRLRFSMRDGAPSAMTLLSLVYPSVTLAKLYNPIEALNAGMSRPMIEKRLRDRIQALVDQIPYMPKKNNAGPDEKWYSYAPLLLDLEEPTIQEWLRKPSAAWDFEPKSESVGHDDPRAMEKHFGELRRVASLSKPVEMGRKPRDLVDVLVHMAMGSPAVCAMRLFGTEPPHAPALSVRLAKTILDRFNLQDSTAIVELIYTSRLPHWQSVLRYCVDGNLQAVLDEYAHVLTEENGWAHLEKAAQAQPLCERMVNALQTNTANYNIDTFSKFRARVTSNERGGSNRFIRMRSGYAAGFYDLRSTEKSLQRKDQLRIAFNSPFRPFVLATTSIGQEGLDFHFYCRKVVHWNLPSNPIDLEQREGRINRYKCLAIRQNIAHKHGDIQFVSDIWNEMFSHASKAEKKEQQPELVPFWCLPEDVPIKIERIVPMYPLSKDQAKFHRLMKILSLYRLSLGQARQEELLEYVLRHNLDELQLQDLFMNLSPYYKSHKI